jgi:hypothetical protein
MNQLNATPYLSLLQQQNELLKQQNLILTTWSEKSTTTPANGTEQPPSTDPPGECLCRNFRTLWSAFLAFWNHLTDSCQSEGRRAGERDFQTWKNDYSQASQDVIDALQILDNDLKSYLSSEPFERLKDLLQDRTGLEDVNDEESLAQYQHERRIAIERFVNGLLSQPCERFVIKTFPKSNA